MKRLPNHSLHKKKKVMDGFRKLLTKVQKKILVILMSKKVRNQLVIRLLEMEAKAGYGMVNRAGICTIMIFINFLNIIV
jgi:hypothetical protein